MGSKTAPALPTLKPQRSEDFFSAYSNTVNFEMSTWDLKLIFGQLDQAAGVIDQHTAITIPWSVAKLALYHLKSQIAAYESFYGKIMLSADILPPEPPPLSDEQKDNPAMQRVFEEMKRLHAEFLKSL